MTGGMWQTVAGGRCPACGSGRLFRGWLALNRECGACGVHFDRYAGNWLGPTVMAYGVGGLAAPASGLVLVPRFGFFSWLAPLLVAVAALAALRPLKAWWIWLLWRSGLVMDDETVAADRE